MKIKELRGNYRFLSNMSTNDVIVFYDGITFDSVERAYQYAKCYRVSDKDKILEAKSPKESKLLGKPGSIRIRSDWDKVKDSIMLELVRSKFSREPLRSKLLNTGTATIVEGNFWHDNYWGNCTCNKCSCIRGKNKLGVILMQVRDELEAVQNEAV